MVRSSDGTEVGFESAGVGPDVLFVHGGVSDRAAWQSVAAGLQGYTCHFLDRRGRGLSADERSAYSFEREYDDVAAVVDSLDGPVHVVGHSSGAIAALGGASRTGGVASLALYEPPLPVAGRLPDDVIGEMEAAVAEGRRAEAARRGFIGIAGLPEPVAARMAADEKRQSLIHTWARECREINRLPPDADDHRSIAVPVLLLVGSETTPFQRAAVDALALALPDARVVELEGQGHVAIAAAPELVATALASFLEDVVGR